MLGLRLYFTTTPNGEEARPSLLALVHVRLPPGFSPSSAALRPSPSVHQAFYNKGDLYCVLIEVQDSSHGWSVAGTLVLAASQTEEKDTLWMVDSDLFPFQTSCMESHVSHMTVT